MKLSRAITTTTLASLIAMPVFALSPAHATTIDVAGLTLDFSNAEDQEILQNAEVNDSYLYENVVTVGGVRVDAEVTVLEFSDNSLGDYPHEWITEQFITDLNNVDDNHVDVAGCYSTPEYVAAYDAGDAYDFLGFNTPGALKGGLEVEVIDEYESDPVENAAINTGLWLCDPGYTSEVDGYVDVKVEFLVDGEPVTLNNVTINAIDIDNSQEVAFWNPAPSTFLTSGDDSLVTIVDQTILDDAVTFVGPEETDEEGFEERYVGEVVYDSVSSFNYTFRLVNGSSGGLALTFNSYFNPADGLAATGVEPAPVGFVALAALGLGSALVIARFVRRRRS